jgi:hypothetical protein
MVIQKKDTKKKPKWKAYDKKHPEKKRGKRAFRKKKS